MLFAVLALAVAVIGQPAEYFYADYDNVVVTAKDSIYAMSALTQEAIDRTKQGSTAVWSSPKLLPALGLYNAKGAVFCGKKLPNDPEAGGKFGQLFVADEGDANNDGKVIGWTVSPDPINPAAIKLSDKWVVYSNAGAQPSDVECGPNNGLFIADQGNDAIYWIDGVSLAAQKEDGWTAVVPKDCGAAISQVRSMAYDAVNNKLLWTNNDEVVVENTGVFSYALVGAGVTRVNDCVPSKCDTWSTMCSSTIKKVISVASGESAWAIADAWGSVQVSKGGNTVFNQAGGKVAEVPSEATYAKAANDDKRDVLFVTDAQTGAVYAASQNAAAANKIADVPDAFGVAYNNGLGKMMMVTPKPVGEITCPSETSSCAGKLAECIPMALDQCPCYAKYSVCLDSVNVGICQMSALSVANAASAKKVCVSTCTEARCIALMQGSTATGTAMATTVTGSLDSAATTVTGSLAATLLVTIVTLAQ